ASGGVQPKAGRYAGCRFALGQFRTVLMHSEDLLDVLGGGLEPCDVAAFCQLGRDITAHGRHLALQASNAGFSGVRVDQELDALVGELKLLWLEAVLAELLRDQELARDVDLVAARVARDLDHLKSVLESLGDIPRVVSGRQEHDLRQIEGYLEVMIDEGVVLRWV